MGESKKFNYDLVFKKMIKSLKEIVNYANKKNVKIAIETEGSFKKYVNNAETF